MTSFRSMSGAAQAALDVRQRLLEGVDHGQRAGARLAEDGDVDLPPAVDAHDVGLDEAGVLRLGDVLRKTTLPCSSWQRECRPSA